MDFIFQGFQSTLPFWVYIPMLIATFILSWWSYYKVSGINKTYRYLLIALRGTVFFILFLLLLNPFVKSDKTYSEPSPVIVLLDNSVSTEIEKQEYQGIQSYLNVLETLNFEDVTDDVSFQFYSFGNEVNSVDLDSLSYDEEQTNLAAALDAITAEQTINAAILLTDGIYTKGQNPVYQSSDIETPIFTVGLGDTTFQEDVLVSSVTTNSSGYLNSTQSVTATINSKGFEGVAIPVELRKGDEILSTETITPSIENSSSEVEFDLLLDEEGLQQFEIYIPNLQEEWTAANNIQRFTIDVEDAKQNILSLAMEIHPDVRFVRSLLLQDQNVELTNRTWLQGDRFIEGDMVTNPDSVDLIVLHGYPQSGLARSVQDTIKTLVENVPLIVAGTPQFYPSQFEQDISSLPVTVEGPWSYLPISLKIRPEASEHPVMDLPLLPFEQLPQLRAPIENISTARGPTTLFESIYRDEPTEKPITAVQELGNKRQSIVLAYNWYQFEQHQRDEVQNFAVQLWQNLISWTATDPENQLLDIQPQQTSFSGSEPVVIDAYLKNERGQNESEGNINISISSDSVEERLYSMEHLDNGHYQLDLRTLPEGIYSFEATAQKGGRLIDEQNGEFSVNASNTELVNTIRNDRILRQIAQNTGGIYTPFDSLSGFWDKFKSRGLLDKQQKVETNFFYLHQHIGWFVLVILLLCGEWILRKYLSLP